MKIGLVAPPSMLNYCITSTQYCLPYLIVENKKYRGFYVRKALEGNTTILDCRRLEWRRTPEKLETCLKAIEMLSPSIIILPSVMHNRKRTFEAACKYITKMKEVGERFAYCIEGTSSKELRESVSDSRNIPGNAFTIAVPSHSHRLCKSITYERPIIYLGVHQNIDELLEVPDGILITSLPLRLGLEGKLLSNYLPTPPSLTFLEEEN